MSHTPAVTVAVADTPLSGATRTAVTDLLTRTFDRHPDDLLAVELSRAQQPYGTVIVAADPDGTPLGVLLGRRTGHHRLFVVYLAVAPHARRRQLATRLLRCAAARHSLLELYVDNDNVAARQLYTTLGFVADPAHAAPAGQTRWQRPPPPQPGTGPS